MCPAAHRRRKRSSTRTASYRQCLQRRPRCLYFAGHADSSTACGARRGGGELVPMLLSLRGDNRDQELDIRRFARLVATSPWLGASRRRQRPCRVGSCDSRLWHHRGPHRCCAGERVGYRCTCGRVCQWPYERQSLRGTSKTLRPKPSLLSALSAKEWWPSPRRRKTMQADRESVSQMRVRNRWLTKPSSPAASRPFRGTLGSQRLAFWSACASRF